VNKLSTTDPGGHAPPDATAVADTPAAGDGRTGERGESSDRAAVGVASPADAVPAGAIPDAIPDALPADDAPSGDGTPDLAGLAGLAMPGRPGIAVPSAVAGSKVESLDGLLVPPPPEAPQARMPSRPRPRAKVITRRRQ
jgi:hypothetical protein